MLRGLGTGTQMTRRERVHHADRTEPSSPGLHTGEHDPSETNTCKGIDTSEMFTVLYTLLTQPTTSSLKHNDTFKTIFFCWISF